MTNDKSFHELFPWAAPFVRRLSQTRMPSLNGETLYITSDYSGSDKRSKYEVYSFLATCLSNSMVWQVLRREVRKELLSDGRRVAFKNLNDRQRARALMPFLEAARTLPAVCVTIAISKSIKNLSHGDLFLSNGSLVPLRHTWKSPAFERLARATLFISLLVAELSRPGQNVYWISDEDELFGGPARCADLIAMLSMWGGMHVPHPLGEVGAGTTAIDPGDRIEEDLAAIPDLVAGATREYINAIAACSGGRVRIGLGVELPRGLSDKTEIILGWIRNASAISHLTLLFEARASGEYSLTQLSFG